MGWLDSLGSFIGDLFTGGDSGGSGLFGAIGNVLGQTVSNAGAQFLNQGIGAGVNALMGSPTGGVRTTNVTPPAVAAREQMGNQGYQQLLNDYMAGQASPNPLMSDPNLRIVMQDARRRAMGGAAQAGMADSGQAIQAATRAEAEPQYQAATAAANRQVSRAGQLTGGPYPTNQVSTYGPYLPYSPPGGFYQGSKPNQTTPQNYGSQGNPYTMTGPQQGIAQGQQTQNNPYESNSDYWG